MNNQRTGLPHANKPKYRFWSRPRKMRYPMEGIRLSMGSQDHADSEAGIDKR